MPRLNLRRQSVVLVAVIVGLMLVASLFGLLDNIELRAITTAFRARDYFYNARQPETPDSPVIIVAIDDDTFAYTGMQWPWPRTYFAQLVDKLSAAGAKVIAFDIFFFEPEDYGKPATYIVQGDNARTLSKRFGVTPPALIQANGLNNAATLCPGQEITVPTDPPQKYVVVRDTLEDLAQRYQVNLETLQASTGITDSCALNPGELIRIPITGPLHYTVKEGDTIQTIAAQYQVNPLAIVQANGQPASERLTVGQTLTVQFGDAALAASIRSAGNVILNGQIIRETRADGNKMERLDQPLPALRDAMAAFGTTNIQADVDGAVHGIQAWNYKKNPDDTLAYYYSWPIVAAARYLDRPLDAVPSGAGFKLGETYVTLQSAQLRVNFQGHIPTKSMLQVVNGDLPPETFKNKIVFIGATSQSLHDIYATPTTPANPPGMPGVEIMAHALMTVLRQQPLFVRSGVCITNCTIYPAKIESNPLLIAAWLSILGAGLIALLLTLIRRPMVAILILFGLIAIWAGVWLLAFLVLRTELPLIAPVATLFLAFALPEVERAVREELEKRRVRGIFEMFISPEMVNRLIDKGIEAMRGQRADLTILFSDIRGFTTLSEKLSPEELVRLLNEYLGAMTDVIHRNGGTVDKYEGDLVMAFFGAPLPQTDHARRATQTAIEMRQTLDQLRAKWAQEGKPFNLEMGVGLNSGEVFVGLVGSGRRVNYTVMGDVVNLASRLQDLTKEYTWPILISEFTYAQVKDQFDAEYADARLVKGKTVPVGIYKVLGRVGAPEAERVRPLYT